jgi:hypothetical protein
MPSPPFRCRRRYYRGFFATPASAAFDYAFIDFAAIAELRFISFRRAFFAAALTLFLPPPAAAVF